MNIFLWILAGALIVSGVTGSVIRLSKRPYYKKKIEGIPRRGYVLNVYRLSPPFRDFEDNENKIKLAVLRVFAGLSLLVVSHFLF